MKAGWGSCPSSFPSSNQVDSSPLVAIGSPKNVDLFIISCDFFVEVMRSFCMVSIICIFPSSSMKKKTRELFGYAFARWKWADEFPGTLAKFSDFWDFQVFLRNFFFLYDDGLPPASSWKSKKCWPICNFGCFLVQVYEFVHNEMFPLVFLPPSSVKKKTRELFGYSFARWKWNV